MSLPARRISTRSGFCTLLMNYGRFPERLFCKMVWPGPDVVARILLRAPQQAGELTQSMCVPGTSRRSGRLRSGACAPPVQSCGESAVPIDSGGVTDCVRWYLHPSAAKVTLVCYAPRVDGNSEDFETEQRRVRGGYTPRRSRSPLWGKSPWGTPRRSRPPLWGKSPCMIGFLEFLGGQEGRAPLVRANRFSPPPEILRLVPASPA